MPSNAHDFIMKVEREAYRRMQWGMSAGSVVSVGHRPSPARKRSHQQSTMNAFVIVVCIAVQLQPSTSLIYPPLDLVRTSNVARRSAFRMDASVSLIADGVETSLLDPSGLTSVDADTEPDRRPHEQVSNPMAVGIIPEHISMHPDRA